MSFLGEPSFELFRFVYTYLDTHYPHLGEKPVSFLKKLGTIMAKILDVLTNVNLLALLPQKTAATVTNVVDRLRAAFNAIITAEQMFSAAGQEKSGSAKLKAATPYIAALIHDTMQELKPGARPKDEAAFEDACTRATAALADALNSYGD